MMQAQLPEGLRALMQASQILQQESSPVVQTPVGPRPTVAGQIAQGLEQAAQTVGMQGVGQQAGLGAQIQAQQAARQQQMAQSPEAIAQLAAQLMQQRQQPAQAGIANLPVNMQFKHGGIVGYNGEGSSDVRIAPVADRESLLLGSEEEFQDAAIKAIRRAAADALKNSQEEVQDVGTPSLPSIGRSAVRAAEASRRRQAERLQESRLQQPEATLGLGAIPTAPEPMPERELFTSPDAFIRPTAPKPSSRVKPEEKPDRQIPPAPQPSIQPSAAKETGIAAIQPPTVPTMAGVAGEAQAAVPDIYEEVRKRREKTGAEREQYIKGLPSLEREGIAAIEQARRERQQGLSRSREDDNLRRFLSLARDTRYGTNTYTDTLDRIAQREESARVAQLSEQQAMIKLKEAEQARGLGQFDRADALTKSAMEDIKNLQAARGQAMQTAASLAGNVFQGQSQFAAAQMREQGEERRKAEEIKMRKQELDTTRQGQALIAAQGKVDSAMKIYNDAMEKVRPFLIMKEQDIKDEGMRNQVAEARRLLKIIEEEQLKPAIQYRDSLYSRVLGIPPQQARPSGATVLRFDAQGNPVR